MKCTGRIIFNYCVESKVKKFINPIYWDYTGTKIRIIYMTSSALQYIFRRNFKKVI